MTATFRSDRLCALRQIIEAPLEYSDQRILESTERVRAYLVRHWGEEHIDVQAIDELMSADSVTEVARERGQERGLLGGTTSDIITYDADGTRIVMECGADWVIVHSVG